MNHFVECCYLSDARWINQDGTIDMDTYREAIEHYENQTGKMVSELVRIKPLCDCQCHRKNMVILH